MTERDYDLGTAEFEVLKALWDNGASTVREVMNHLHERARNVAYTTVLTFLTRLEQKGFVSSDKTGLAYVYRPKVSREKVSRSRARKLLEQLYDGAAGPLVLHLVKTERLSANELDELQRLVSKLDRRQKRRVDGETG